jgi:hypothetical protein
MKPTKKSISARFQRFWKPRVRSPRAEQYCKTIDYRCTLLEEMRRGNTERPCWIEAWYNQRPEVPYEQRKET